MLRYKKGKLDLV